MNVKGFYLLLTLVALRTLSLSPLRPLIGYRVFKVYRLNSSNVVDTVKCTNFSRYIYRWLDTIDSFSWLVYRNS